MTEMTNLNMILLKFETSPSSLLNFGTANSTDFWHVPGAKSNGTEIPCISFKKLLIASQVLRVSYKSKKITKMMTDVYDNNLFLDILLHIE